MMCLPAFCILLLCIRLTLYICSFVSLSRSLLLLIWCLVSVLLQLRWSLSVAASYIFSNQQCGSRTIGLTLSKSFQLVYSLIMLGLQFGRYKRLKIKEVFTTGTGTTVCSFMFDICFEQSSFLVMGNV